MQDAGEEEDDDLREGGRAAATHEGRVDVAAHKVCDGLVPCCPVCADGADVPPVAVELSVAEAHDFSEGVECGLEEGEEAAEPAEDGDCGKLHGALGDGGKIKREYLVEGVLE